MSSKKILQAQYLEKPKKRGKLLFEVCAGKKRTAESYQAQKSEYKICHPKKCCKLSWEKNTKNIAKTHKMRKLYY